jgi:uncharacterized SAM-binding protein YcdF (DUF218 family)
MENVIAYGRRELPGVSRAVFALFLRLRRRILVGVVVLALTFAALTARVLIWPAQGMPSHVDAIVMLAGPGGREAVALRLARERHAPVLVVSLGQHGYSGPCPAPVPGARLICFEPDPGNTRGEAEFTARLAVKYHWHSVVLVTTAEQDSRARMLLRRCFGGEVYVVTAPQPLSTVPREILYGWGALLKALTLVRAC